MWSNLLVLHSESKDRDLFNFPEMFHWKTCMRTVLIGDSRITHRELQTDGIYKKYEGYDAYKLLLEIVSGLRSRLLGETEVLFQFKEILKNSNLPKGTMGDYLMKLKEQIIEDSRKIRSGHLRNLGDQSYGGLAHRYLKDTEHVTLFGTGQLADQLLPWLLESNRKVKVVGRNEERLIEIEKKFGIITEHLDAYQPNGESVVIAAPISVNQWIENLNHGVTVVDFREDDMKDQFPSENLNYISFAEMLHSLKENEVRNAALREQLEHVLTQIVEEREYGTEIHIIHGWEDLPCLAF